MERAEKRIRTWIFGIIICVVAFLAFGMLSPNAKAAQMADGDDPLYSRANGQIDDGFFDDSWGISLFSLERDGGCGNDYTLRRGIDVSHYQGEIDWAKVKESGVEFVIVRVGYRGYGTEGNLAEDRMYEQNIQGALDAGLKVGVYIYSQAITEEEAVEEADFLISRVFQYNITLPLVMDFEWPTREDDTGKRVGYGRLYDAHLSQEQTTDMIDAFCDRVREAGYTPMVYANRSTLEGSMYADELAEDARIWLANYQSPQMTGFGNPTTPYQGVYDFFQFSSQGSVPGISGYVDLDYWYDDGTISGKDYSSVFNAQYYAEHNADVKALYGNDTTLLFQHFLNCGMSEGRRGNEEFDPVSYLRQYADLRAVYGTDWTKYYEHYMTYGKAEGRSGSGCSTMQGAVTVYKGVNYSAVYDFNYYISANADVRSAYPYDDEAALEQFVKYGMNEGRRAKESFDVNSYRNANADLRHAYGWDWEDYYVHYIRYGRSEGRRAVNCSSIQDAVTTRNGINYAAVYDYAYYLKANPDVSSVYAGDDEAALLHFINYGMKEGRSAKSTFDVKSYRNANADLRRAYGTNWRDYYIHYIQYGKNEGRRATNCDSIQDPVTILNGTDYAAVYSYNFYVSKNADVAAAYAGDDLATLKHFVNYGMKEGRQASENFSVQVYRQRYGDLNSAYGSEWQNYYLHYLRYGISEGRSGR